MIKLDLPVPPSKLTSEKQDELTRLYKEKGTDVWKQCGIPDVLFKMTCNKCSFSEIKLGEEGKYGEIEHFYPKDIYKDDVVKWGNLLPISNICNRKKWVTDPSKVPLLNPLNDNPKDYFSINNGRLYPKKRSEKAINTIEKYGLNDPQLTIPRNKIEKDIGEILKDILEYYKSNVYRCVNRLKNIMSEGKADKEYSATVSTYILNNAIYQELKLYLIDGNLWDDELTDLEKELEFCSLPK